MLFSEIHSSYFNVVAAVLAEAANGGITERRLTALVRKKALLLDPRIMLPRSFFQAFVPNQVPNR